MKRDKGKTIDSDVSQLSVCRPLEVLAQSQQQLHNHVSYSALSLISVSRGTAHKTNHNHGSSEKWDGAQKIVRGPIKLCRT